MNRRVPVLTLLLLVLPLSVARGDAGPASPWDITWVQTRTASVRVHHAAALPIEAHRLTALEASVRRIAVEVGLDRSAVASLGTSPIEYLYVDDPAFLGWFGAGDVDGVAHPAERRIVAARLPHDHELVHVLAYMAISPAPEHNHPWLQEGLASYLGGHLGEAPASVLATGDEVLDRNPGVISSMLTVAGFRRPGLAADDRYALCARFVHFLDVRGGRASVIELLRLLAGREEEVLERPASVVRTQLEGVYETGFAELLEEFEAWRVDNPVAGVVHAVPPGRTPDVALLDAAHQVRWWIVDTGWFISARPRRGSTLDLSLTWEVGGRVGAAWTAPGGASGYELRIDETGGRLVDHGAAHVALRWFDGGKPRDADGGITWFIPADSISAIRPPSGSASVALWSQPRFEVD